MIDIVLNPPAVVRKLIFPSPLHQNNERESKTKKTTCKRKRKLISVMETKPSFCMEMHFPFQDNVAYKKPRTATTVKATAVTSVVCVTLKLILSCCKAIVNCRMEMYASFLQ